MSLTIKSDGERIAKYIKTGEAYLDSVCLYGVMMNLTRIQLQVFARLINYRSYVSIKSLAVGTIYSTKIY
jgi:hypothetical protein